KFYLASEFDLDQADKGGHLSELKAWDPVKQSAAWGIKEDLPFLGGVMSTGGGLVFYGNTQGELKAVDAKTGSVLWKFNLGTGIWWRWCVVSWRPPSSCPGWALGRLSRRPRRSRTRSKGGPTSPTRGAACSTSIARTVTGPMRYRESGRGTCAGSSSAMGPRRPRFIRRP